MFNEELNFDLIINKSEIRASIIDYRYVTLGNYLKLSNLNWKISNNPKCPVAVFTDSKLNEIYYKSIRSDAIKIAIILEPIEILNKKLDWLISNFKLFDFILTYEESFLKIDSRFVKYQVGGSFLRPTDKIIIKPKDKLISMVFSQKKYLPGHIVRHQIYEKYKDSTLIDFYGNATNPFYYQGAPHSRYKFSIIVENILKENFFTEKLIDCLLFKTIPIYYGDPKIGKFFNHEGLLKFKDMSDLISILNDINESRITIPDSVILENQQIAAQYISKEHNIEKVIRECLGFPKMVEKIDANFRQEIISGNKRIDPSVQIESGFLYKYFLHFIYKYVFSLPSKSKKIMNWLGPRL